MTVEGRTGRCFDDFVTSAALLHVQVDTDEEEWPQDHGEDRRNDGLDRGQVRNVRMGAGDDQSDDEVAEAHRRTEEAADHSALCDHSVVTLVHHGHNGTERRGKSGGFPFSPRFGRGPFIWMVHA